MAAVQDAHNWLDPVDLAGPVDPAVIAPHRLFVASAAIAAAVAVVVDAAIATVAVAVAVVAIAVAIAIGAPFPAQGLREQHFAARAAQPPVPEQGPVLAQLEDFVAH